MKKCPYCAEEIQDEALKCRFCSEMLAAPATAATLPAQHAQLSLRHQTMAAGGVASALGCSVTAICFSAQYQSAAFCGIVVLVVGVILVMVGSSIKDEPRPSVQVVGTLPATPPRVAARTQPSVESQVASGLALVLVGGLVVAGVYSANSGGGSGVMSSIGSALSSTHEFDIKVGGSGAFQGSIAVIRGGKSEQRSVSGDAPTSFHESGTIVSVTFQHKDSSGSLSVSIDRDGSQVASQETSSPYGVVSAATH